VGCEAAACQSQELEQFELPVAGRIGARVVARAWADSSYKQRLMEDGAAALAEFQISVGADLRVVEHT
jgi:nitrile hydratase